MSVVVQCFHCSHVLELDDGFRGGVCRCSQCGGLLQVPKGDAPVPRPARAAAPVPRPVGKRGTPSGTDIGISSGRLDPRNAPIGNYRGAADPGFSSGRLNPQSTPKSIQGKGPTEDISNAITVDAPVKIRPAEEAKPRRRIPMYYVWAAVLLLLVAVAIVAVQMTVGL